MSSIADKLSAVADNVARVFDAGKAAQYNNFWDILQQNGNRTEYLGVFSGWNDEIFKPKYTLTEVETLRMAFYSSLITQLGKEKIGGETISVNTGDFYQTFTWSSYLKSVDVVLDASKTKSYTAFNQAFRGCYALETVKKIIPPAVSVGNSAFNIAFQSCAKLKNITFGGTILDTGLDFKDCPLLTKESLLSILTHLTKDSSIAQGKSITFNTASQSVMSDGLDVACLLAYDEALAAGWTIAFI